MKKVTYQGKTYTVDVKTGRVLDDKGKPVSGAVAQAVLRMAGGQQTPAPQAPDVQQMSGAPQPPAGSMPQMGMPQPPMMKKGGMIKKYSKGGIVGLVEKYGVKKSAYQANVDGEKYYMHENAIKPKMDGKGSSKKVVKKSTGSKSSGTGTTGYLNKSVASQNTADANRVAKRGESLKASASNMASSALKTDANLSKEDLSFRGMDFGPKTGYNSESKAGAQARSKQMSTAGNSKAATRINKKLNKLEYAEANYKAAMEKGGKGGTFRGYSDSMEAAKSIENKKDRKTAKKATRKVERKDMALNNAVWAKQKSQNQQKKRMMKSK